MEGRGGAMSGTATANLAQGCNSLPGCSTDVENVVLERVFMLFLCFRYFLLCDVGNDWKTSSVEAVRVDVINCSIV
ncbi:hypothetical protein T01_5655 [Trichinella spiralis]|uniref:Uncharacterized protein n=1 Tax=Trichinella spiralis TaxID=6334 RepID=A0A0V1BM69_TRISP|nr:hypothetical protein T01_5655 [Trichinella spiralis]